MTAYYVDAVSGDDTNTGLLPSEAWASASKVESESAGATFQPGDRVLFSRGAGQTFGTFEFVSSGTSGSPITLGSYGSGALPVMDGAGVNHSIRLNGTDWLVLEDFALDNDDANSLIRCDGGVNNCVFRRLQFDRGFHALTSDAISLNDGNVVEDCTFTDNFNDAVSVDSVTTAEILVRHCTMTQVGVRNPDFAAGDAVSAHGSIHAVVEDCFIDRCKKGITHVNDVGTNVVRRCLIVMGVDTIRAVRHTDTASGIETRVENTIIIAKAEVVSGAVIYEARDGALLTLQNCTTIINSDNVVTGLLLDGTVDATTAMVVDNYLSVISGSGASVHAARVVAGTFTGQNNWYYPDEASPLRFSNLGIAGQFSGWNNPAFGVTETSGTAGVDPLLTDPTGAALAGSALPLATSPVIGAGLVLSGFVGDYFGTVRGQAWDPGAAEVAIGVCIEETTSSLSLAEAPVAGVTTSSLSLKEQGDPQQETSSLSLKEQGDPQETTPSLSICHVE